MKEINRALGDHLATSEMLRKIMEPVEERRYRTVKPEGNRAQRRAAERAARRKAKREAKEGAA